MAHHFRFTVSPEKTKKSSFYEVTFVNTVTDVEVTMRVPSLGVYDVPGSTRELTLAEANALAEDIKNVLDRDLHEHSSPRGVVDPKK